MAPRPKRSRRAIKAWSEKIVFKNLKTLTLWHVCRLKKRGGLKRIQDLRVFLTLKLQGSNHRDDTSSSRLEWVEALQIQLLSQQEH